MSPGRRSVFSANRYATATALLAVLSSAPAHAQSVSLLSQVQTLTDPGMATGYGFGVAIDGDDAIVGAFGGAEGFIYERSSSGVWTEVQSIAPSTGGGSFGRPVAIDGDTVVVGAWQDNSIPGSSGTAWVFVRNGAGVWIEQQRLTGNAGTGQFGRGVAVDGDTAVIGAPTEGAGAVYVFVRNAGVWTQQQRLVPSAPSGDNLGFYVDLEGDRLVAGAPFRTGGGVANVYLRSGTTWSEEAVLVGSDTQGSDLFGRRLALSGSRALIGSPRNNSNAGAAYVFNRTGTTWTQQAKIQPADGSGGGFGWGVALEDEVGIVSGQFSNSVFVFDKGDGAWTERNPATAPSIRLGTAMVFDMDRNVALLFGGDGTTRLDDTWEWDGTDWMDVTPASGNPPGRGRLALTYDSSRQRVVLFGGIDGVFFDDTWEWDGAAWTDVTPVSGNPSPRALHAMAYDPANGVTVLFGGLGTSSTHFDDTWEWDGSSWTDVTPTGTSPSARRGHAMAYDPIRDVAVMFGGAVGGSLFADTWEWDGSSWTEISPTTSPDARSGHGMVYDSARGRVVLHGGFDGSTTFYDNTWEWDGADWVEVTSEEGQPGDLAFFAFAYDQSRGRAVLFGGADAFLRDETWEWAGETWKQRQKIQATVDPGVTAFGNQQLGLSGGRALVSGSGAAYVLDVPPPPDEVTITPGATGGEDPGPEPPVTEGVAVSSSDSDTVFVGASPSGQQGVFREVNGQLEVLADAATSVPAGTGTFDNVTYNDVDVETTTVAISSSIGVYASEDQGALVKVADTDTAVPDGGGTDFDTFGQVEVTNGDIHFQGGSGGTLTGIYRDRNRALVTVVDTTTSLPSVPDTATGFRELESGQGEVAFTVETAGGPAVFKADASAVPVLTFIADTNTLVPPALTSAFVDFEEVSIRNGVVSFVGIGSAGIYRRANAGNPLETVVDSNDAIPTDPTEDFENFDLIGELDNGEVAFVGFDPTGNTEGIFRASQTTAPQTMFAASTPLPNGSGLLDKIGPTTVNGDRVIFVGLSAQDEYLGTFEVSITSAVTDKAYDRVTGGDRFIAVGRPFASGVDLVFLARTPDFQAVYRTPLGGAAEAIINTRAPQGSLPKFERFTGVGVDASEVFFVAEDEDGDFGIYGRTSPTSPLNSIVAPASTLPNGGSLGPEDPGLQVRQSDIVYVDPDGGVFLDDRQGGPAQTVADTTTPDPEDSANALQAPFATAVSDAGRVVFLAHDASSNPAIYEEDNGVVTLVANASTDDPVRSGRLGGFGPNTTKIVVSGPDIVFTAENALGEPAIYLKSGGGDVEMLVEEGDAINITGELVQSLANTELDYENGNLVFTDLDAVPQAPDRMLVLLRTGDGSLTELATTDDGIPEGMGTFKSFGGISVQGSQVLVSASDENGRFDVYTLDFAPLPPAPAVPGGGTAVLAVTLLALVVVLGRAARRLSRS